MVTPSKSLIVQGTQTSDPGPLYYTIFDGSSWTAPVRLPHGMASPNGMSLAVDSYGALVGIHRNQSGNLYCSSYNSESCTWTLPHKIEPYELNNTWPPKIEVVLAADSRLALARFRDRLYCVYRCANNEICYTCSWGSFQYLENLTWERPKNVGDGFRTSDGPALASFDNRLICVVRSAKNNRTYWSSYSGGKSWRKFESLQDTHDQFKTSASPALAVYNNELYCFLRGMDQMTAGGLFWSKLSEDGRSWSRFSKIKDIDLLSGPSFTIFNKQLRREDQSSDPHGEQLVTQRELVCTVRGGDNQLWYGTINVQSIPFGSLEPALVTKAIQVDPIQCCQGEQGLCDLNSKLFCVYGAPES